MAVGHSDEYIDQLRFPRLPILRALIAGQRIITASRRVRRRLFGAAHGRPPFRSTAAPVSASFEQGAPEFRHRRWTFVENFFDAELHRRLVREWPGRKYFAPPSDLLKSYDRGFEWWRAQKSDPAYLERFPAMQALFTYLRSDAFARRVTDFAKSDVELSCYSFLVTATWPGSLVAPHRDTIAYSADGRHFINFVMFVNGSGGPGSGGLALMEDNKFGKIYFETKNVHNTALIYDVSAPGYHGFEPVRLGKFRWAIISNFCAKDFRRDATRIALPGAEQASASR